MPSTVVDVHKGRGILQMAIPDADYAYEALLRFNYFPMVKEHRDELPPVFSTEALTPVIADALVAGDFKRKPGDGFDQIEYRATRFNNVVRRMEIPHPLPYAALCQAIRDNWSKLNHVCTNNHSRIKPEQHGERLVVIGEYDQEEEVETPGRLVVMERNQFPDDLVRHLELATGAKYCVDADIANCFPSIYTHSIPWALVGHEVAKKNRNSKDWFNAIDAAQRYAKRGETQGVPIGPATSNVLSEIILTRVDEAMVDNGYRFQRFIDDYCCYTDTREEAEKFIRDLEYELDKFLLKLNAKKVSICRLPKPHKAPWVNQLTIAVNSMKKLGPSQIAAIFDYALHLQNEHPEGSVIKYAARMLMGHLRENNAAAFVECLLHLAVHHPVVLPLICESMHRFKVDCNEAVIRKILTEHLEYRRFDGVCWSIYLAYLARRKLGKNLIGSLRKSGDCMSLSCLLAVGKGSKAVNKFLISLAARKPTPYELDQYWLLILEGAGRDASIRKLFKAYLDDTGLSQLLSNNVSFLVTPSRKSMKRVKATPLRS